MYILNFVNDGDYYKWVCLTVMFIVFSAAVTIVKCIKIAYAVVDLPKAKTRE